MTSTDREGASSLARSGPGPRVAAIAPPIIAPEHPILSAIRSPSLNAWRLLASAIGPTIAGYSSRIDVYTAKAFLNRWGMVTKEAHDLGAVYITFVGDRIVSFRFTNAWAQGSFFDPGDTSWMEGLNYQRLTTARNAASKYFVPSVPAMRYNMLYHSGTGTLDQYPPNWNRSWKGLSLLQRMGCLCSQSSNAITQAGRMMNMLKRYCYKSWLNGSMLGAWNTSNGFIVSSIAFWLLVRFQKSTHPFRRLLQTAAPSISTQKAGGSNTQLWEICLMLNMCELIWVRDLKNAYHLVRLGGCRGRTQKLPR